jgi:hypothetical protein
MGEISGNVIFTGRLAGVTLLLEALLVLVP